MADLHADTDLLKSPALEGAQEHMSGVRDTFRAKVGSNPPLTPHIRGAMDKQIADFTPKQIELVERVLDGVWRLTKGDIGNVHTLSALLEAGEEDNVKTAGEGRPSTTRH